MTTTNDSQGAEQQHELGPIDYIVLEWPGRQPNGEVAPFLVDLVERGIIRILDVALMVKDEDGEVAGLDLGAFDEFGPLMPMTLGLLSEDELEDAARVLEPGTSAAVLIWENRWALPVANAMRRSGGQLVASGRIPLEDFARALDATENEED